MMPVTIKASRVPVVMTTSGPPAAPPGGIQTAAHPFGPRRVHRAGGDDPARPWQSHDPVSVARTSRRPDHAAPSPPPITCTRWQLRAGKRLPHRHAARAFLTGAHADLRDPSHLMMARPGPGSGRSGNRGRTDHGHRGQPRPRRALAASDPLYAHRHHTKDQAALEMLCPLPEHPNLCAGRHQSIAACESTERRRCARPPQERRPRSATGRDDAAAAVLEELLTSWRAPASTMGSGDSTRSQSGYSSLR